MADGDEEQPDSANAGVGDVGSNIRRIREGRRMSYVELAQRLADTGRPIPVLGLRRIENGDRRIDVGDLLAISVVLGVTPVDLLVPSSAAADEPYEVTPLVTAATERVRAWIGGGFLVEPESAADLAQMIATMPAGRAQQISAEWLGQATHDGLVRHLITRTRRRGQPTESVDGPDLAAVERDLRTIRRDWRRRGGEPPALPEALHHIDEEADS